MADGVSVPQKDRRWLIKTLPQHERLAASVRSLLENMLRRKSIEYLSVSSRVKTFDGAIEKIGRKTYRDPAQQLTDLSGIRVITYLEEQVSQISATIKELFEIDRVNSLDRTEILGDDKVGYRSTHFVCTLGRKRRELPENKSLGDLKFEIQVRTVLQHAWAELAHDRSFKFGAALPIKIQRKLNLYSGMLEIVDSAFDEVSKEIEKYRAALKGKTIEQLSGLELNSLSLHKFITDLRDQHAAKIEDDEYYYPQISAELREFGVRTVGELEKLLNKEITSQYFKFISDAKITATILIHAAMLYADFQRALEIIPIQQRLGPRTVQWLSTKYSKEIFDKAVVEKKIELV